MLQSYPNLEADIKARQNSLKIGECWILVAGEVGAGKSSIINLFLECQLLPMDALKCTNTIVEIRCSDIKEARCHFKPPLSDSGTPLHTEPRIIKMNDLKGLQEFKDCVAECDENDDNPYDHIELYYPFKTLSKNVVIVDTPGIEGGSNVDHRLQKYLKSAFGFLYVINTNTAGGVSQSRLGHLLKTVVNSCEEFSPESSLFIGNKWENVPDCDKADVQKDVFDKLSRVYPGIRGHQIHYMSVTKAKEMFMKHQTHSQDHVTLLQKIGELIPNSLRQGLTNQYWWLSAFLSRTSYVLRVTGVQHEMSAEEVKRKYTEMQSHVSDLQRDTDACVKKLREKIEYEIFRITKAVQDVLNNRNLQNRLCNWEDEGDCPKVDRKWKRTVDEAAMKISTRIANAIDGWQRENRILQGIDVEIVNQFAKEFGLLNHHVEDIEKFLTHSKGQTRMMQTVKVMPVRGIFGKKTGKVERTYSTLGGAVSCIGMLDTNNKEVRELFRKQYTDKASPTTKAATMAKASTIYLRSILDHKDMPTKLRKFFERFFKDIDEAAKRIPIFLKADQQLIETLRHDMTQIEEIKEKLPSLATDCADLHGSLDIFYVNKIMKFDFDLEELDWANKQFLGSGSFAEVFSSELKRKRRPVALKVASSPVKSDNVTEILMEDRTMRELRHPNIIRYFGATYVKKTSGLVWIMVMELCNASLKSLYIDDINKDNHVPGMMPPEHPRRQAAVKRTLTHCLDIVKGLEYIHEKGYTHRDMKLENVLIGNEDVAKITDVGVTKQTSNLVRTCNGSPAYMAPEVLLSTKTQTNKIDIYSLALIYWEMWFGHDVSSDMNREILGLGFQGDALSKLRERQGDAKGGWRPSLSHRNRPPNSFIDIIKRSWSDNPDQRPEAKEIRIFLEELIRNN
ncbi:uncharacterized protein LOC127836366 isoform X4 [Dreissena polymorpha]|nr:uncharacterized protein LOC127836366 isoform X2 [Dreissena polymorpha]XP_052218926.1 uncharacterized protein LOC127836366 isoform X3 [Dreissena polymorpha]XP_052218927.1 uncharacterized protein LOC127836366 isoform X4 [Dreissena polymorpha]